jgi:hypothetical protein
MGKGLDSELQYRLPLILAKDHPQSRGGTPCRLVIFFSIGDTSPSEKAHGSKT